MSSKLIIIKNSAVTGRQPTVSDLQFGELAINYNDGKLFFKNNTGLIKSFVAEPDFGKVKSVDISGGVTGLTFVGGPITTSGVITLEGTLTIENGGTGATTKESALINLLPTLPTPSANAVRFLSTNDGNISWQGITSEIVTSALTYTPVNRAGDTMTGNLILNADPVADLGAATKRYVDQVGTYTEGSGIDITNKVITNTGVLSLTGSSNINVSSATGTPTVSLTGVVQVANGGTGAATRQEAINALSGTTLTPNRVLRSDGINVTLSQVNLISDVTGVLPVINGGTGQSSFTSGYIRSNGTSLSSFALIPGSDIVGNITGNAANVTGIVSVANGGTGQTSFSAGYIKSDGMGFVSSTTLPASDISGDIPGNSANVTGVVAIANGGTGKTTANEALNELLPDQAGNQNKYLFTNGEDASWELLTITSGTVTSVDASGGTTGLSFSGGPITENGILTLSGLLNVGSGGTGSNDGSIIGTGALTFTAGGEDTSIVLVPNGIGSVNVSGKKITNLGVPTEPTDAVNKQYVDAVRSGLDVKDSVRVATTENISLNGLATLIDGVTLTIGDRVLVKNQTDARENGIYDAIDSAWVRTSDADNTPGNEVTSGMFVFVEEGTANADTGWILTTDGIVSLGTTELSFTQFSSHGQTLAGSGLIKVGNIFNVDVDNTTIEISENALRVKDTSITFAKIQNIEGLSVIGNADTPNNTTTAIIASDDHTVLRRSGSSLSFGSIDLSQTGAVGTSTLSVANGGTGASTADGALTKLLPTQANNTGKVLSTNGSVTAWITPFSGSYNDLTDKPLLFDGQFSSLTNKPTTLAGYGIIDTVVTSVNGLTPAVGGGGVSLSSSNLLDGNTLVKSVNTLVPDTNGNVAITLLNLGISEGTSGQVLSTNGLGLYSFVTPTVTVENITGVLPLEKGGTGKTTANEALNELLPAQIDNAGKFLKTNGSNTSWAAFDEIGLVTSVAVSGGTTGLTTTGGPITSSGTITLEGTLNIANGGTGATTQQDAINALVGTQSSGTVLRSDGTNVAMGQLNLASDVTGILTVANGGTGQTSFTSGYIKSDGTGFTSSATIAASDITGSVAEATTVDTTGSVTTNADHYLAMTALNDGSAQSLNTADALKYNPSTSTLNVPVVKMLNAHMASISYVSTDDTTDQIVDSISSTAYRTIKYTVQVTSGTDYHSTEIILIHNGMDVFLSEYGSINTNIPLATFNADILSGQVRLLITPVNQSSTIKAIRYAIDV